MRVLQNVDLFSSFLYFTSLIDIPLQSIPMHSYRRMLRNTRHKIPSVNITYSRLNGRQELRDRISASTWIDLDTHETEHRPASKGSRRSTTVRDVLHQFSPDRRAYWCRISHFDLVETRK